MDEALKEQTFTRAEEFRRDEGPDDDEPLSPVREERPDVPQQQDGVLDDRDADRRADLARYIDPSVFPARPEVLLASAERNFAPDWIIAALRSLPDDVYGTTQEVWRALGGPIEERRA